MSLRSPQNILDSCILRLVAVQGLPAIILILGLAFAVRAWADADYWVRRGEEQFREGDKAGALESFQRASWERPQDPVLYYNMGVIAEALGRFDEAADDYLTYLRWDRSSPDRESIKRRAFLLCGRLGSQSYHGRDFQKALDWYEKARQLYPESKAVYFNQGRGYEAIGDLRRAEASYRQYWVLCKGSERESAARILATLLRRRAEEAYKRREFQAALAAVQEARKYDQTDPALLLGQARCEESLGFLERAADHYFEYLGVAPEAPQKDEAAGRFTALCLRLAETSLSSQDPAKALRILERALKISPQSVPLHALLARAYQQAGKPEQSLRELEEALKSGVAGDARAHTQNLVDQCLFMADAAFKRRDYRSALQYLQKAQASDPENALVAYNLAETYKVLEQWKPALQEFRRYLALSPNAQDRDQIKEKMAYCSFVNGADLYRDGNYAGAQEAFEEALLVRPQDPALLYNLALVFEKRGKVKPAIQFLERYLQYERNPEEVRRAQGELARLLKESGESAVFESASVPPPVPDGLDIWAELDGSLQMRQQAYRMLQVGRWEEAISCYEQHLRRFPGDEKEEALRREISRAYSELSRAALLEGNYDKAMTCLQKMREWSPSESSSYLWEGNIYESLRMPDAALRMYQDSLRLVNDPQDRHTIRNKIAGMLTQRVGEAIAGQDYPQALAALSSLEPYLDGDRKLEIYYQRAQIKAAMGLREEALVDYALHLSHAPMALNNPRIRNEIATQAHTGDTELASALQDPQLAAAEARAATARNEHSQALFYTLLAMRDPGQRAALEPELLKTLQAARTDLDPVQGMLQGLPGGGWSLTESEKQELAELADSKLRKLYQEGLYEEGLDLIRKVGPVDPGRFLAMEGMFEEMLGMKDEALQHYEQVLRDGSGDPATLHESVRDRLCSILVRRAITAYAQDNLQESLAFLKRAEVMAPGRKDVAFDLGCIHLRAGEPDKALDAFSKYLSLASEDSPRKTLTSKAVAILKRKISRSNSVRYDSRGVKVDLIFEKPGSLGQVLSSEKPGRPSGQDLLDSVLLGPFLEQAMQNGPGEEEPFLQTAG